MKKTPKLWFEFILVVTIIALLMVWNKVRDTNATEVESKYSFMEEYLSLPELAGITEDGQYYISKELVKDTLQEVYLLERDSTAKEVEFQGKPFKGKVYKMEKKGNYYYSSTNPNSK